MSDCPKPVKIPFEWTEGNTLPDVGFVLPGGQAVSAFTITLRLDRPDDTVVVKTAIDLGGSLGKFVWAAADLIAGENQRAQMTLDDGSGGIQTLETMLIDVRGKV
ncbi:hypothetical protein LCGC14_2748950 [marine sediment metagenome]|uniref:Uncharacterized protein n=1 Tax=marine sediment metagenome TaxID=412755 RepID=A0A0F9BB41_9ZZZZ